MDRTFLTQMSESFCNDFSLKGHGIWESREAAVSDINQYLVNLMKQVSYENPSVYHEMHGMSRSQQYAITYFLIEDFINEEYPDNEIFIIEEQDLLMTEIGLGTGLALAGGALVAADVVARIIQYLIKQYRGSINKIITKKVVGLFNWTAKHFNTVKSATASRRAVDAIIYSNLEKCGKQCNVSDEPGNRNMGKRIEYPARGVDKPVDKKSSEQFNCLFKCYIEYNIGVGKALFDQYQQCTKNRVNRDMMLYMNQPESDAAQCSDLYKAMVEHFGLYKDVIESLTILSDSDKQLLITAYFKGVDSLRSVKVG